MSLYIDPPPNVIFNAPFFEAISEEMTVLELGSGSGMVGCQLSRVLHPGRDLLILTDLPEVSG